MLLGPGRVGRDLVKWLVDQAHGRADDAIGRLLACDGTGRGPAFRMKERRADDALQCPLIIEVEGVAGDDRLVLEDGRFELATVVGDSR